MDGVVTCQACDRQYRWKEDLAGRKMKCKCGGIFVMPVEPDVGEQLYEKKELQSQGNVGERSNRCPSCGGKMKPGAVLCIGCGYNTQTGEAVVTAINAPSVGAAATAPMEEPVGGIFANAMASQRKNLEFKSSRDPKKEMMKNIIIPSGIAAVSFLIICFGNWFISSGSLSIAGVVIRNVLGVVIMMPILLLGLFVSYKVVGIGYGQLHVAILKLAAILLMPDACKILLVMVLSGSASGLITGALLGSIISFIVYYLMIAILFDLDAQETIMTVIMLFLTKFLAGMGVGLAVALLLT